MLLSGKRRKRVVKILTRPLISKLHCQKPRSSPRLLSARLTQKILYAHDCAKEAEERYAELLAEVA